MAREREAQQSPGQGQPVWLEAPGPEYLRSDISVLGTWPPLQWSPDLGLHGENSSVAGGHSAGPQPGWDPYGQLEARAQTHFLTHERGRACPCLPRRFELILKSYQITLIIIKV